MAKSRQSTPATIVQRSRPCARLFRELYVRLYHEMLSVLCGPSTTQLRASENTEAARRDARARLRVVNATKGACQLSVFAFITAESGRSLLGSTHARISENLMAMTGLR